MKLRALTGLLLLIYFATAFFSVRDNFFHNDDVEMMTKGAAVYEKPGTFWEPDNVGRNHMLLYLWLGALHGIFGLTPLPFYLSLLLFHALVFFLIRALAEKIGLARIGSHIGALFFLVLSIHFQMVGWIAEMGRLLMNVLGLAALLSFHRFRVNGQKIYLAACCLFWFLAFHCSEEAIVLPVLFAAYDFLILGNRPFLKKNWHLLSNYIPMLPLFLLMLFQLMVYREGATAYFSLDLQAMTKIRGLLWTMVNLVIPRREALWPFLTATEWSRSLLPLAVLSPLGVALYRTRHALMKDKGFLPLVLFALTWFAVSFGPFSLRPIGDWREYPQPRYLYTALIGVSFLVGKILEVLWKNAATLKNRPIRRILSGGMALAAFYFYTLNVWTFHFMVNKLDATSRIPPLG